MDPIAAERYRVIAERYINGLPVEMSEPTTKTPDGKKLHWEPKAIYFAANVVNPRWNNLSKAAPGSVAVYPIQSVLMQEDYCGAPGLKTIRSWVEQAESNANITHHMFLFNTPGGDAMGVKTLSEYISSLRKPTMAYVEGMAASGGLWLSSATDSIYMSEELAQIGSLGAFSTFYDSSKAREEAGYRKIEVYAPQSTRKNKMYRDIASLDAEVATAAQKEYADRFLKPLVENFQTAYKTNRAAHLSKMPQSVFEGDMFNGTEAVNYGMADGIASFNEALRILINTTK